MSNKLPWDGMKARDGEYFVKYIIVSGDVNLWWARDNEGQCLFIVRLRGDYMEQFRKQTISVNGIQVDMRWLPGKNRQGLILTLEKHINQDLFYGLCRSLIDSLDGVADPSAALDISLKHIQRWKAFFAAKRVRVLSPEEVRGLFAELSFLRILKTEHLSDAQAVEAWCGPDRIHQDFIFGNTAVEVKSISGRDRSIVKISSEDQLETVSDHLFLKIYRLAEAPDDSEARSLNELVSEIGRELSDAEAIEGYWQKLATYGYEVEMKEYDSPKFLVKSSNTYRISDDFPRLVRSELPDGVVDVKYSLQLEKIAPHECDQNEIWKG